MSADLMATEHQRELIGQVDTDAAVSTICDAFPGARRCFDSRAEIDNDVALRSKRRAMSATHADLLWEDQTGMACLFIGTGGHYDGGHYDFANTSQLFFAWPKQRSDLLDTAMRRAPTEDVYLAPLLRTGRSRKKGTAGTGRYLWADCDGLWTDERAERLAGLMSPGSFVVMSGRGRHVYVRLAESLPAAQIESLNRRLAHALDGDTKWDETALLRLAGTWSHKGYASGGSSVLVRWGRP